MNKEIYQGITKDDVWGEYTEAGDPRGSHKKISQGMIIAQGIPYKPNSPEGKDLSKKIGVPAICPITKKTLPYKSVSVVCKAEDQGAVEYWLEYVHGAHSIDGTATLDDGKVVIISNYMCW